MIKNIFYSHLRFQHKIVFIKFLNEMNEYDKSSEIILKEKNVFNSHLRFLHKNQ
jgi:hypothetical protein